MFVKVEEIINEILVEEGKTSENDFLRYFKLSLGGIKELSLDVGGNTKTIELLIDSSTMSVVLPDDYVKYTKIGRYLGDGEIHSLGLKNKKSLINTTSSGTSASNDELDPTYFEYITEYGLGGGNNTNGYYRVDMENRTIQFTSDVSGPIVLEYVSNSAFSARDNAVVIHELLAEALKSYIFWKSIQRRRGVPPSEKTAAKQEYLNQKRLARARYLSFNKEEALQASRKAIKQAPKM
tara:strand:+ start:3934 stop:4644 length:711 start_codon:yes stop_codon:yes gene_type:complete